MTKSIRKPLGVAVIGYAFMGKAHSHAWRSVNAFFDTPEVEQRLLVGRDPQRVAAAADRFGWKDSETDWRAVLDRDDIDIVDICAPGILHSEIAIAALEAGKHVIVEKPMATTVADAVRMRDAFDAAAKNGAHAIVNFNYRRVPAIALAKKLIEDGRLGQLRHVRAAYLQDWLSDPAVPMSWRLRKEEAGSGVLGDLGSHLVDLILHLTGESVTGLSGGIRTFVDERPRGDSGDGSIKGTGGASTGLLEPVTVDDAAWASAQLTGGAVVQLEVSRFALGRKNELTLALYGDRGSLLFNLENLNELWFFDGAGATGEQGFRRILVTEAEHPYAGAWWPDGHILGWEHAFTHQFAEFLNGIKSGTPTTPSFDDGLRVQRVLQAVEDSATNKNQFTLVQ